jgi:hypothetical protein
MPIASFTWCDKLQVKHIAFSGAFYVLLRGFLSIHTYNVCSVGSGWEALGIQHVGFFLNQPLN